jgi:hypothetical protein
MCIIGAPNQTQTPILPWPPPTTQYNLSNSHIVTTNSHKKPSHTNTLVITITAGVRGAIHEHFIDQLTKLKIPKNNIKTLMKKIHENAIKYLTYLVLNKRKLDNKQTPVPPP